MHVIHDADSMVYAAGFVAQTTNYLVYNVDGFVVKECENKAEATDYLALHSDEELEIEPYVEAKAPGIATSTIDDMIFGMLDAAGANSFSMYLTGGNQWRQKYATIQKYKGNRDNMVKPVHYDLLRAHLVKKWGSYVVDFIEADDAVVMEYVERRPYEDVVISHIDKDIDQQEGLHLNYKTREFYVVDEHTALMNFYTQLLTGDSIDNIPGLSEKRPKRGIGAKTAATILDGATTEREMFGRVHQKYVEKYGEEHKYTTWLGEESVASAMEIMDENAQLLYLQRFDGDRWQVPV